MTKKTAPETKKVVGAAPAKEKKVKSKAAVETPQKKIPQGPSAGVRAVLSAEQNAAAGKKLEDADLVFHREISSFMKQGKVVLGSRSVLRGLKNREMARVYVSSTCPPAVRRHIELIHFDVPVYTMQSPGGLLGESCGKPFAAAVLGIRK